MGKSTKKHYIDGIAQVGDKFYIRPKVHGKPRQLLAQGAKNRAEARVILEAEKYKMRQQEVGLAKVEKPVPLKDLCDIYKAYNAQNNRQREPREKIEAVRQFWGLHKDAAKLKQSDIIKFRSWLMEEKKLSNSTINRYVAFLSKAFNLAIEDDLLIKNPCSHLDKLEEPEENVKYLTKEETDKVLELLETEEFIKFKPLVLMCFNTGFRISNVNYMRWEWINMDKKLIRIKPKDNKGKQDIKHRINDDVYSILMELGVKDSGYLFAREETGMPYANPSRDIINKIFNKAGIEANGFHIIRHSVGTTLGEGTTPTKIKAFLHHKDVRTSMKYVHNTDDDFTNEHNIIKNFLKR